MACKLASNSFRRRRKFPPGKRRGIQGCARTAPAGHL